MKAHVIRVTPRGIKAWGKWDDGPSGTSVRLVFTLVREEGPRWSPNPDNPTQLWIDALQGDVQVGRARYGRAN